jgi:DNA adenine methylase
MMPERVRSLVQSWHAKLWAHDVQFTVRDYTAVRSKSGDLLYLDPPYRQSGQQVFYGKIDFDQFFAWLGHQRASHLLSLNGFVGDRDIRVAVPQHLYDEHLLLETGASAFHRLNRRVPPKVLDSLYIRVGNQRGNCGVGPEVRTA